MAEFALALGGDSGGSDAHGLWVSAVAWIRVLPAIAGGMLFVWSATLVKARPCL
jgi:hypothetical protein